MTTMQEFRRMAQTMDERVRQLAAHGVKGPELIFRMVGHMPELQKIWMGTSDRELAILLQDYPGFYEYASLMEDAAEQERANPKPASYKDLPQLPENLKVKMAELLTDAATPERRYQSFISGSSKPHKAQKVELRQLHQRWLTNREKFSNSLMESGLPEGVSKITTPMLSQIADRISNLEKIVLAPNKTS